MATYYISDSAGNDTTGTGAIGAPWKTISKGTSMMSAGDTLYIRSGTYTGSLNTIDSQDHTVPTGSAGSIVTISAYPSETVTIRPQDETAAVRFTSGKSYITVVNLTLDGVNYVSTGTAISVAYVGAGASHITFQGCTIKNSINFGMLTSDTSTFVSVIDCIVFDNGEDDGDQTRGHGLYVGGADSYIYNNTVYNNAGYGIQCTDSGGPTTSTSRGLITNNLVYNNGSRTSTTAAGIAVGNGADTVVSNNLIYSTDGRSNLNGIMVFTDADNAKVYNNTIYNNGYEGIYLQYYASAPIIRNNIAYNNGVDYNDHGGTGTPTEDHNLFTDPLFTDAGSQDFSIQSGSAAKDAGIDLTSAGITTDFIGTPRPQGSAFDIGAYEYFTPDAFYVSDSAGNDTTGDGSFDSPWKTIKKGVENLSAGDVLYIRGGTYTSGGGDDYRNTIDSQHNTVGEGTDFGSGSITISGYPGETAIIQPASGVSGIQLYNEATPYLIIQDLTIDMSNSSFGVDVDGIIIGGGPPYPNHIRLQRLDVKDGPNFGIHTGVFTSYLEVLNCQVHGFGTVDSYPSYDGHGLYMSGSNCLIEGNEIYDCAGYAVHLYSNVTYSPSHEDPNDNIVRNNDIHDNGFSPLQDTYGIVVAWGSGNLVYNNLVYNNTSGISVYTDSADTLIANNTVYGNSGLSLSYQYCRGDRVVRNNIFYGNGTDTTTDYGGHSGGTLTEDHNLYTDPSFTNAGAEDFTLQSGSSAIDAGTTITDFTSDYLGATRPQGSAYDIGAYEFEDTGGGSGGSVEVDTITTSSAASGSSRTVSHTVSGADREMLITVTYDSDAVSVSSVVWNTSQSASLVNLETVNGTSNAEVWGLLAPATGTHNVVVTFTGSIESVVVVASFTGVDQTTPIDTVAHDHYQTGTPDTNHTHNTSSQTGGLVWDAFALRVGGGTISVNSGQTTQSGPTSTTNNQLICTTEPGATTVNTGYTWVNEFWRWVHITVPLIPANPGTSGFYTPSAGSLAFTGQTPTRRQTLKAAPSTGSASFTGLAPTRLVNDVKFPPVASLSLAGQTPTLAKVIPIPVGSFTVAGLSPTRVVGSAFTVIDVKQGTSGSAGSSLAASAFSVNPSTGDNILVAYATYGVTPTHTAPTDTAGNTYTQIGSTVIIPDISSRRISLWVAKNITGGSSFVVTGHQSVSTNFRGIVVWNVRSTGQFNYNSDFASQTTTGTNPTSTTSSPAPTSSSFFLGVCSRRGGNLTDNTLWNIAGDHGFTSGMKTSAQISPDTNLHLATEFIVGTSAAAATWTASSAIYGALVASFSNLATTPVGSLTFTGQTPSLGRAIPIPVGSMSASGIAASLIATRIFNPAVTSLSFTGLAAVAFVQAYRAPSVGPLSFAGIAPTSVIGPGAISPQLGAIIFVGNIPNIITDTTQAAGGSTSGLVLGAGTHTFFSYIG